MSVPYLIETKDSREFDLNSKDGSATFRYLAHVVGEANPEDALYVAILANLTLAPYVWNNLVRGRPSGKHLGNGWYEASLPYRLPDGVTTSDPGATTPPGGQPPSPPPSQPTATDLIDNGVSLEIGGKPPRLMKSIKTFARSNPPGKVAPDFKGMINVGPDKKADGVDAPDPAVTLTLTRQFDYVTWGYVDRVYNCCYRTNEAPFAACAAGELLLLGASLRVEKSGKVAVTFKFGVDKGEDTIELIPGVGGWSLGPNARPPWHYLWLAYGAGKDAGAAAAEPLGTQLLGAYVEQLFKTADYSVLGLG